MAFNIEDLEVGDMLVRSGDYWGDFLNTRVLVHGINGNQLIVEELDYTIDQVDMLHTWREGCVTSAFDLIKQQRIVKSHLPEWL
jgi:hypothetical protein